jgi:hypothetical protein
MRTRDQLKRLCVGLFATILLCLLCYAIAPFPILYRTKPLDAPEYISSVWPPPESTMWLGYYNLTRQNGTVNSMQAGICVKITTWDIAEEEFPTNIIDSQFTPFKERVHLYVDGTEINSGKTTLDNMVLMGKKDVIYNLSTGYQFCWKPTLSEGDHLANFVIDTASGKILEYEWHFTIQ